MALPFSIGKRWATVICSSCSMVSVPQKQNVRHQPMTRILVMLTSLFLGAVLLLGLGRLTHYQTQPGPVGQVPENLTSAVLASLSNSSAAPTGGAEGVHSSEPTWQLLVFVHPKCPCTRATIHNLDLVSRRSDLRLEIIPVIFRPLHGDATWLETDNTRRLATLTRRSLVDDEDSQLARQFNVQVSGHCLLYDCAGRLRFSGGITASRGHEGRCRTLAALTKTLEGHSIDQTRWPVYGCQMY